MGSAPVRPAHLDHVIETLHLELHAALVRLGYAPGGWQAWALNGADPDIARALKLPERLGREGDFQPVAVLRGRGEVHWVPVSLEYLESIRIVGPHSAPGRDLAAQLAGVLAQQLHLMVQGPVLTGDDLLNQFG